VRSSSSTTVLVSGADVVGGPHEEKTETIMRKTATRETGFASDDRRWKAELSDPDLVKKKSSRRPDPRWVEREPDSALARLTSLAEIAGSRLASGRSPDLVSQKRKTSRIITARSLPDINQWRVRRRLREHYSGGTARESHPLPYSPRFDRGTRSSEKRLKRT
jgi:hypothetical protein